MVGTFRGDMSSQTAYSSEDIQVDRLDNVVTKPLAVRLMKMDIEGFEYQLLPQLMMNAPRVLCDLGVLAIEWHEHMVPKYAGHTEKLLWWFNHSACNLTALSWV